MQFSIDSAKSDFDKICKMGEMGAAHAVDYHSYVGENEIEVLEKYPDLTLIYIQREFERIFNILLKKWRNILKNVRGNQKKGNKFIVKHGYNRLLSAKTSVGAEKFKEITRRFPDDANTEDLFLELKTARKKKEKKVIDINPSLKQNYRQLWLDAIKKNERMEISHKKEIAEKDREIEELKGELSVLKSQNVS